MTNIAAALMGALAPTVAQTGGTASFGGAALGEEGDFLATLEAALAGIESIPTEPDGGGCVVPAEAGAAEQGSDDTQMDQPAVPVENTVTAAAVAALVPHPAPVVDAQQGSVPPAPVLDDTTQGGPGNAPTRLDEPATAPTVEGTRPAPAGPGEHETRPDGHFMAVHPERRAGAPAEHATAGAPATDNHVRTHLPSPAAATTHPQPHTPAVEPAATGGGVAITGMTPVAPTVTQAPAAVTHLAGSSAAPAPQEVPPLTDQLVPRIAALRQAGPGEHVLTVRVDPESFGPVRLVAHISEGAMRIDIVGGTDAAREALRSALPDLRRDLAGVGLNAELNLSEGNDTRSGSHHFGQQQTSHLPGGASTPIRDDAPPAATPAHRTAHDGVLDVTI